MYGVTYGERSWKKASNVLGLVMSGIEEYQAVYENDSHRIGSDLGKCLHDRSQDWFCLAASVDMHF